MPARLLPAASQGAEFLAPARAALAGGDLQQHRQDRHELAGRRGRGLSSELANDRTPRYRMRVSTREPDGAWVPSEQLSGAGEAGAGAVGVDPQGRITAVWDEAGKVMWSDKAAGQPWTPAQAIPDGDGQKPDLFVASDGTATAVWQKGTTIDTYVIRTTHRPLGGAWSAVETISPAWSDRPARRG